MHTSVLAGDLFAVQDGCQLCDGAPEVGRGVQGDPGEALMQVPLQFVYLTTFRMIVEREVYKKHKGYVLFAPVLNLPCLNQHFSRSPWPSFTSSKSSANISLVKEGGKPVIVNLRLGAFGISGETAARNIFNRSDGFRAGCDRDGVVLSALALGVRLGDRNSDMGMGMVVGVDDIEGRGGEGGGEGDDGGGGGPAAGLGPGSFLFSASLDIIFMDGSLCLWSKALLYCSKTTVRQLKG